MSTTALYLVCPPGEAASRLAELQELLTVTDVTGPFPPPAPDALARMQPVGIPGRQNMPWPGEPDTGPGQGQRPCYRLEARL
jgi:hypothetical protein